MWEVQPHRDMTKRGTLRVQELCVDASEPPEISLSDTLPKLFRILLTERHDRLPGPIPEVVCLRGWSAKQEAAHARRRRLTNLLDVVDEEIMDVLLLGIKLHQLVCWVIGEVHSQLPRRGIIMVQVIDLCMLGGNVMRGCGLRS